MRCSARLVTAALLLLLVAQPLNGQWLPEAQSGRSSLPADREVAGSRSVGYSTSQLIARDRAAAPTGFQQGRRSSPVTGELVLSGLIGAAIGTVAGAYIGYMLDYEYLHFSGGDDPGLGGLLIGWAAGSAVTTPALVHSVNDQRGSLSRSYASSAAISAVTVALTLGGLGPAALAAPIANVISAIWIETSTAP